MDMNYESDVNLELSGLSDYKMDLENDLDYLQKKLEELNELMKENEKEFKKKQQKLTATEKNLKEIGGEKNRFDKIVKDIRNQLDS